MPLQVIRERARASPSARARRAREVLERYDLPANVLDRLAEIGVLTPDARGYDADDVAIIEAIVRFRAGGYDEALGFTVYDTLRYREALAAARRGGGPHAARPPRRRGRRPSAPSTIIALGPRAAARADRRACTPSCCSRSCAVSHQRTRWRSMTPITRRRSSPATGSEPANVPNGCS